MLTAARELQQVNNEIQSPAKPGKSLINQAKNLASLPYSSLAQLQQSINQTEQLLTQAQRIAYSVTSVNQAFTQSYPQAYSSSTSAQQLLAGAETRWQNALAGTPGRDARTSRRGAEPLHHPNPDRWARLFEPRGLRRPPGGAIRQPAVALQTTQLADLTAVMAAIARAQSLEGARNVANQAQAQQQLTNFLSYGLGYQPGAAQMFH